MADAAGKRLRFRRLRGKGILYAQKGDSLFPAVLPLKSSGPLTHITAGNLTGPGAAVAGTSQHKAKHTTAGGSTPIAIGASTSVAGASTTTGIDTQVTGSTFVAFVFSAYGSPTGITDNKGNNALWTPLGAAQSWNIDGLGWDAYARAFICENGAGGTGHTITAAGTNLTVRVFLIEITGAATASGVDINDATTVGSTANPCVSGSVASTQADELLLGLFSGDYNASAGSWNNSFTMLQNQLVAGEPAAAVGYRVVSSTGTYQASLSRTASNLDAAMWLVSIKKANTGGLIGQGAVLAGTAARFRTHPTSGALTGPGAAVAGTAERSAGGVTHPTSGALTGPGAAVAGTAARFRAHPTSGALTGPGAAVAGTAEHKAKHPTSGALTGPGAAVAGTAARFRAHPTAGALTGPGAAIAGTAARSTGGATHPTSGALTGPGAAVAGTAVRFRTHPTSGALTGPGAAVSGTATRFRTHATSGTLTGPGAAVAGTATNFTVHPTSGALTGPGAALAGTAARFRAHPTSGALTGPGAAVAGTAARSSVYPAPSDVRNGVVYGPGGIYTGTLSSTGGATVFVFDD